MGKSKGNSEVELVNEQKDDKNWKGIGLALLVIVVVLALVVTASVLIIPPTEDTVMGEPFTYESLFDTRLMYRPLQAEWAGENTYVHRNTEGSVVAVDLITNKTTFIMSNNTFRQLNTPHFWVSPDLNYVLLAYNTAKKSRYTQEGFYAVYNVATKKLVRIPGGVEEVLQHASWGPTGSSLAFVKENALFYQSSVSETEKALTNLDDPDYIYNAMPDWLYDEEILKQGHAYWWSPDGGFLAYIRLNDRDVPEYKFPIYTDQINIQGKMASVRYPKAGNMGRNPTVELFVADLPTVSKRVKIDPPPEIKRSEYYLLGVTWQDGKTLAVTWLNRAQNLSVICLCEAGSGQCRTSLTQTTKNGALPWLEMDQKPLFTPDGLNYFLVLPQQDGTAGYYQHVAMVSTQPNAEGHRTFLTHGHYDVINLVGYDDRERSVYVIAAYQSPIKRQLLKVTLSESGRAETSCLSCHYNTTCQYVSAKFSPSGQFYFMSCLGPELPSHFLMSTTNSSYNVTLDDNADVNKRLSKFAMPVKEYHTITVGEKYNTTLELYLPPTLNKKHVIRYPVLLYVYGGPGSQEASYRYIPAFKLYMSSGQSVIVASVNSRGAAAKGGKFKSEIYKKFGTVEVDDQIAAIEYLRTLFYVDRTSISVYGWSYGGFLTGHIVARAPRLVKCAVMGAPVTDFRYYDTFYTEKYMGSPTVSDNLNGYEVTSLMNKLDGFKQTKVLIVHGTADDNVHYQNSAHLIRQLVKNEIPIETQIYTDERHEFTPEARRHFYRQLTNFLNRCYSNHTRDYVTSPPIREPETV